ncbi:expressed unknown protein [Seminavis robusta]|uniref:Peptidase M12B domain-containing protein n=1 Tax=Seminavis robusta TaxID=568900 RepID=A0A9N8HMV5_9STRA|nr:expressed unknown protein [Seminavis robusta]|eukprot:Sro1031_g233410.1 n/a (553) ;mRNA; r:8955-10693
MATFAFPMVDAQENGLFKRHALVDFERQHHMKKGAHTFQQVPKGAKSVDIDGKVVSLEDKDLIPINIFSENAKFVVDGVERVILLTDYESKDDPDVIVTMDANGGLVAANKMSKDRVVEVAPIPGSDFFVTVAPEDLDEDAMKDMEDGQDEIYDVAEGMIGSPTENTGGRKLRGGTPNPKYRSLQEGCPFTDYIQIHIVLDSYFVAGAGEGSVELAKEKTTNAIASVNTLYMAPLCVQYQISMITVWANPSTDPMRNLMASAPDMCRGSYYGEILYTFADEIQKIGKQGDLAQFISGRDDLGGCVGQAFTSKVGRNNYIGGAYGLSVQNWAGTPSPHLFAHETGHNLGAQHPMFPDRNDPYGFGSANIDWMKGFIEEKICAAGEDDYTCVSRVAVMDATDSPTKSPTRSPTPGPSPSPTTANPTSAPTANPTESPTTSPTSAPTANPTKRPTPGPSPSPTTANPTAPQLQTPPRALPAPPPQTQPSAPPQVLPQAPQLRILQQPQLQTPPRARLPALPARPLAVPSLTTGGDSLPSRRCLWSRNASIPVELF